MADEINSNIFSYLFGQYMGNLKRLDNLVEYLETQDVISEDNPAFKDMCNFYMELEQIATNFHSIIETKITT